MTRIIAAAVLLFSFTFAMNMQAFSQGMPPQMQQEMPDIEVSDSEMQQFVEVTFDAQRIQMDAQQEMVEMVEDAGLSVERFNQILTGMQQGQSQSDMDVEDEEMERFDGVIDELEVVQQKVEDDITKVIEDKGMEVDRFQEINMALQMDPELQQKYQEIAERMEQEEGGM